MKKCSHCPFCPLASWIARRIAAFSSRFQRGLSKAIGGAAAMFKWWRLLRAGEKAELVFRGLLFVLVVGPIIAEYLGVHHLRLTA